MSPLRILWVASALVAHSGCFRLDPLLYVPERLDAYLLAPEGDFPEETVSAERIEPVWIPVPDEEVVLGAVYIQAQVQPPRGYVIFSHGKGGNLDTTMPRLKRYANIGYDVLGYDYRGFGVSTDVAPSEAGLERDGQAVVAYMRGRVPEAELFYAGQSFGTAPATQAAVLAPPRALILEAGFASVAHFTEETTNMDLPQSFVSEDGWDTAARLAKLQVPVLLLHGTKDDLIRPSHMAKNFAAANGPKEQHLIEGGGHSDLPQFMGPGWGELIHAFVDHRLGGP